MPVATISHPPATRRPWEENHQDLGGFPVHFENGSCRLDAFLENTHTDALTVVHKNRRIWTWQAAHYDDSKPHILLSISKSVTGILAGILEDLGLVNPDDPITRYVSEVRHGVYAQCTVRNLLDMTVSLDFEENYTDPKSEYVEYRKATCWNPVDQSNPGPGLEAFLSCLKSTGRTHGSSFLYRSPNTDMLGLVLEKAGGGPFAQLLSECLWKPLGAREPGYVTLDRHGRSRAAGGVCIHLDDLVRLGQLFLDRGQAVGRRVVSENWILDTFRNGDRKAWKNGNYAHRIPGGAYRNQWYRSGDESGSLCARGIHGQQLYINPATQTVIGRLASHPQPICDPVTDACFRTYGLIARELG